MSSWSARPSTRLPSALAPSSPRWTSWAGDGGGWNVIEVKSSFPESSKMDDYVDALAYSTMVLRRAAVAVKRSSLLLLSRAYRHGPVEKLFTLVDKTDEVDKRAQVFEHDVDAVDAAVRAEEPPQPVLNRACWRCDFFKASCLGSGRGHTVVELPKLHHTRIKALCEQGAALLRRGLFRLFIGVFACGRALRCALRGDSAPTRLFSGSQPDVITAPGRLGLSPPAPPPGHSRGVLLRCRGKGEALRWPWRRRGFRDGPSAYER